MTPEQRRLSNIEHNRRWRSKNPAREKMLAMRQAAPEARRRERAKFSEGHRHECIRCETRYTCTNACDPIGEGLRNSLCMDCFNQAVMA